MPSKKTKKRKPASKPAPKMSNNNRMRILKSRVTYRAPVFYVTSELVKEPSGITARRDVIRHPGSVVILPVDENGVEPRVLLERQFRYAAGKELWELPAGRIDEGESALEGAKRELLEETGYMAKKWKRALYFYVSPGFLTETMSVYLAQELKRGKATPEADEVIQCKMFPLSSVMKMVMTGRIEDAKTISGVLWFSRYLQEHLTKP